MWFIYTMEYYSSIKRKILPFAAMWMDLEIIRLHEVSHTEKDKYYVIYIQNLKNNVNEYKRETNSQT